MNPTFFHPYLFLLLLSISINLNAQQKRLQRDHFLTDFVFTGNHIQFNFSTLSVVKARIQSATGNHPVNTKAALGLALGFKYQVNFNNQYSLITGPEAVLSGRNFITSFKQDDFSPPLIRDYDIKGINGYTADLILRLPILVQKRRFYDKTRYLFADAGVCLNVSTGADFETMSISLKNVDNGFYDAGEVDVYANNDAKPWVSLPLNIGHAWLLKNNNLIQLSLCANTSFTRYVDGVYLIQIPGRTSTQGRYSSTGSYFGLSMNYVFTSANYRIRKEYERKYGKLKEL